MEDNSLYDQGDKADGNISLDEFRHPVIDGTDFQFVIEHLKASLNVGQSLLVRCHSSLVEVSQVG